MLSSGLRILYGRGQGCKGRIMLGYITGFGEGAANGLLADVAMALQADGVAVVGAVQIGADRGHMDLRLLGRTDVVRISQDLGPLAQGCRLDAEGLERAVGLVRLDGAGVLIVNKFGKQEAAGRGFRPLIGQAVAMGLPVVVAVAPAYRASFETFAGGMAQALAPEPAAVLAFCQSALNPVR
jgi:hypothetical protein